MSEESPNQELFDSDNATALQHDVEDELQDVEHVATEDNSPEEDSRIDGEQNFTIEEDPSNKTPSLTDNSNLQNDSLDFREKSASSEPVTVVVDPQEANKNFLMELERTRVIDNQRTFEMGRPYIRNTILSVSADSLMKYPSSRYYKENYVNAYPKHTFYLPCIPSWRTCLCFFVYNLFLGYLCCGVVLFSHLEGNIEVATLDHISSLKNDTAILLATELRQVSPHEPVWAQYVFKHLDVFEENLLKASGVEDWRRAREGGPRRWTKKSSLFYSLALMTRTGYCSMSPKSEWGRTATVCYSLFAVPVTMAWFMITGRALAHLWSRTLDIFCCYMCIHYGRKREGKKHKGKNNNKTAHTKANSIAPIDKFEKPTTSESNFVSKMKYQELRSAASARSVASARTIASARSVASARDVASARGVASARDVTSARSVASIQSLEQRSVNDNERELKLISMDQAVCIVFSVLFLVVYFVIGSALMAIKEDFAITDSLYFNFLMLATIGPACSDFDDSLVEAKISNELCHFYFLYGGYSILSMVFYLIFTFYFPTFESYWTRKRMR